MALEQKVIGSVYTLGTLNLSVDCGVETVRPHRPVGIRSVDLKDSE